MWIALQLLFAGAWASIWHWGLGVGLIILLLACAYFTTAVPLIGPWLTGLRRDLLWAAAVVAIILGGEYVGNRDSDKRCVAKTIVVEKVVTKAVASTKTNRARQSRDPWDSPAN